MSYTTLNRIHFRTLTPDSMGHYLQTDTPRTLTLERPFKQLGKQLKLLLWSLFLFYCLPRTFKP